MFRHYQVNGSWTENGEVDGTPYAIQMQDTDDVPPPLDDEQLDMQNLQLNDTGWYTCRVTNVYGGIVSSGWVEVVEELDTNIGR